MAPWIQSNEMVVIEWYGIKNSSEWSDDDLVSDAVDFKKALKMYVQYAHYRDFGEKDDYEKFHNSDNSGLYDEALADLMWQSREETKLRGNKIPSRHEHFSYIDALLASNAARQLGLGKETHHHHNEHEEHDEDETIVFGHIGNNGCGTPNADLVSWLVRLWHPRFIVASGGNTSSSPVAPVLTATSVSGSEIDLSWTAAELDYPLTYNIYRNQGSSFKISEATLLVSNIPASQLSYHDSALTASTQYCYFVEAVDMLGDSTLSNQACATTNYILTAPYLSGGVTGSTEITLSWTQSYASIPPTNPFYSVYRGSSSSGPFTLLGTTNDQTYVDDGPGISQTNTYYYQVIATDGDGNTADSNIISVYLPVTGTGPSSPVLGATAVSTTEIDLTLTPSTGTAPITYTVYGAPNPQSPFSHVFSTNATFPFAVTGLTPGTKYNFYVEANNAYGAALSNGANATTFNPPPSAPVLSLTYVSPTELDLSWSQSSGTGVSYTVWRSTSRIGPFTQLGPSITAPQTYNDTSVTNADTENYYYYIIATDSGGTAQSNTAFNTVALIPIMGPDNTTPSGTANASDNPSIAFDAFQFGPNPTTGNNWQDLGAYNASPHTEWVSYDFTPGLVNIVTSYTVWLGLGSGTAATFVLQGYNGSAWVNIDTAKGISGGGNAYYSYSISNSTAYYQYRLLITYWQSPAYVAIAYQLYGG